MISVIIPCQEDDILLFPTVDSIFSNKACSQDFEVLLVCSRGFAVPEKVNRFPVKVFSETSLCQAEALNWGVSRARGDLVCTTKPGCVVASDWLAEIDEFLQTNRDVDGVGGPILPASDYGTKIQKLASEIFSEEQGFPDSVTVLDMSNRRGLLHATNSAFRKKALCGLRFDASFDYDYDFDICLRMVQNNHRVVFNPRMKVEYIFPLSLRCLLRRYYRWGMEKVVLQKRYSPAMDFKSFLFTPYNTVRSLFEPSPYVSTKKLLRFVQHLAFNTGILRGYGLRATGCM
jgi:cellulose synthase/poly-beta-1,6-N-acetylglucosamine synthase-like glycosyltransferase